MIQSASKLCGLSDVEIEVKVSQLKFASGGFYLRQRFVEDVLRDPAVVLSCYVPKPAHAPQQCVYTGDSSSLQSAVICDFVLPGDVQDTSTQRMLKALRLRSRRARRAQVSLPYRGVLKKQAL